MRKGTSGTIGKPAGQSPSPPIVVKARAAPREPFGCMPRSFPCRRDERATLPRRRQGEGHDRKGRLDAPDPGPPAPHRVGRRLVPLRADDLRSGPAPRPRDPPPALTSPVWPPPAVRGPHRFHRLIPAPPWAGGGTARRHPVCASKKTAPERSGRTHTTEPVSALRSAPVRASTRSPAHSRISALALP